MTSQERIERLRGLLAEAKELAAEPDPVLDEAMPRVVAIVHDALRILDLDYLDNIVAHH